MQVRILQKKTVNVLQKLVGGVNVSNDEIEVYLDEHPLVQWRVGDADVWQSIEPIYEDIIVSG